MLPGGGPSFSGLSLSSQGGEPAQSTPGSELSAQWGQPACLPYGLQPAPQRCVAACQREPSAAAGSGWADGGLKEGRALPSQLWDLPWQTGQLPSERRVPAARPRAGFGSPGPCRGLCHPSRLWSSCLCCCSRCLLCSRPLFLHPLNACSARSPSRKPPWPLSALSALWALPRQERLHCIFWLGPGASCRELVLVLPRAWDSPPLALTQCGCGCGTVWRPPPAAGPIAPPAPALWLSCQPVSGAALACTLDSWVALWAQRQRLRGVWGLKAWAGWTPPSRVEAGA